MLRAAINQNASTETMTSSWSTLYKFGGAAALSAIAVLLLDIAISFGGGDFRPDTLTAVDWFAVFQSNRLVGLRALGLINIISLTVTMPLYLALYAVHRQVYRVYAALAMILYVVGAAVYISNNAAVPMFVLSSKYAAAAEAQRIILAAAGEAVIARGADFTPGSFIGFFFTEIAGIAFAVITLRSRIFGRVTAYSGILGFLFLSVFTIVLTFIPALFDTAILIAVAGGFFSVVWYGLVGRGLLRLGLRGAGY